MVHGSDWPVVTIDPLVGIYSALTREDAQGKPAGGWFPDQRLTFDQVVAGYTRNAAYCAFMDDRLGTLEPGKLADFVVLERDLRAIPVHDILTTAVLMTAVDGRVVYEGKALPERAAELQRPRAGACACHRFATTLPAKV
jgi:predicted amidohydrolase YtcJ